MAGRRIAGLLSAGAVAIGLGFITPGVAQATPAPVQGTWYEVFNPFVSTTGCLDMPAPSTGPLGRKEGITAQIWHCHGSASDGAPQRWYFNTGVNTPGQYTIENAGSIDCLWSPGSPNSRVYQDFCISGGAGSWAMLSSPYGSDYFVLQNIGTGYCMAQQNTSGGNGTPVVTKPCDSRDVTQQWHLA